MVGGQRLKSFIINKMAFFLSIFKTRGSGVDAEGVVCSGESPGSLGLTVRTSGSRVNRFEEAVAYAYIARHVARGAGGSGAA